MFPTYRLGPEAFEEASRSIERGIGELEHALEQCVRWTLAVLCTRHGLRAAPGMRMTRTRSSAAARTRRTGSTGSSRLRQSAGELLEQGARENQPCRSGAYGAAPIHGGPVRRAAVTVWTTPTDCADGAIPVAGGERQPVNADGTVYYLVRGRGKVSGSPCQRSGRC